MLLYEDTEELDSPAYSADLLVGGGPSIAWSDVLAQQTWSPILLLVSVLILVLTTLTGCGSGQPGQLKVYQATGSVKYQGQPIENALLFFRPKDKSIPDDVRPHALTDKGGHFDLGTYTDNDGAPAGEYDVIVTWRPLVDKEPGPNQLPERYSKFETSQLIVQVKAEDLNDLQPLQLTP